MAGGNNQTAAFQMRIDGRTQNLRRSRVERHGRLVEQPQRPHGDQKPGKAGTALLAGRKICGGELAEPGDGKMLQGKIDAPLGLARSAQIRCPELDVLADRKVRFDGVGVAYEMGLFGNACIGLPALQPDRTRHRPDEPGDRPKQRRFARSVGADQHDGLARIRQKRQSAQNRAATALDSQIFGDQAHGAITS